jgi:RimJ/RimL family protein N-acetyltransferase
MNAPYTIRPAVPDDAAQMLQVMRAVADEDHNGILYSRSDGLRSIQDQRKLLEQRAASENCIMLVAEAERQMIGYVSCIGGVIPSTKHTVSLAILVKKEWRDKGVGTALMQRAVAWAEANPIVKRLELDVFTVNSRAVHIYKKVGFQEEGIKRQVYFKDGQFVDAILMAIIFER